MIMRDTAGDYGLEVALRFSIYDVDPLRFYCPRAVAVCKVQMI